MLTKYGYISLIITNKRFLRCIALLCLILGVINCSKTIIGTTSKKNLILDQLFNNGILVQGSSSAQPEPIVKINLFAESFYQANWYMPQWGSRYLIANNTRQINNDTIILRNNAKKITFFKTKEKSILIGLYVFASEEYDEPRELNEDWVHLLLEQKYEENLPLLNTRELTYSIKAKLQFCENKMGNAFDAGLHTAQITQFFTIQNRNANSAHFGDFFWFGLPLYDYRYRDIQEYSAQDLGKDDASNKFILSVATKELYNGSLHDMTWKTIDRDILPFIKKAFVTAQKRGYMKGTLYEDLYLTSMNIGWEVPGTFDCGILFECPSLIVSFNNFKEK